MPVGSLKPNDFGFFDVNGNSRTWCQNSDKSYPNAGMANAREDRDDDLEINPKTQRVVRGGSWGNDPRGLRASYRYRGTPDYRLGLDGFRCGRDALFR